MEREREESARRWKEKRAAEKRKREEEAKGRKVENIKAESEGEEEEEEEEEESDDSEAEDGADERERKERESRIGTYEEVMDEKELERVYGERAEIGEVNHYLREEDSQPRCVESFLIWYSLPLCSFLQETAEGQRGSGQQRQRH